MEFHPNGISPKSFGRAAGKDEVFDGEFKVTSFPPF
jgi:hypothetical protein